MSTHSEGTYISDVEHAAEMARLIKQARAVTRSLGGLFPQRFEPPQAGSVLDIACGPGEWALGLARSNANLEVTGIDLSQNMIGFANSIAQAQALPNIQFQIMDATRPLQFPDATFDLINTRFIFSFMPVAIWPQLLSECMRLLRPGGVVMLNEAEFPLTNSPATEKMHSLTAQALFQARQSFSPDGRQAGITPMLPRLVKDAGFQQIQLQSHAADLSAGTELNESYLYPNYMTGFLLTQPFLVKMGVATQMEVSQVYEQMLREICAKEFCAISFFLSVWGYKLEE